MKDAIMHPNVQDHIDKYISSGGSIQSMIEILSKGYKGNMHMIDALGSVMEKHGFSFQQDFEKFLFRKLITNINPHRITEAVDYKNIVVDWVETMISSTFWITIIIELSKRFPNNDFLNFCLSSICKQYPEKVSELPPCSTEFESFSNVFYDRFTRIRYCDSINDPILTSFVKIAATDDLSIMYTLLSLDRNVSVSILQLLEAELENREASLEYMQSMILRLEQCPKQAGELLISDQPLTTEQITFLMDELDNRSQYLNSLICKRLLKDLFNFGLTDELRLAYILALCQLTSIDVNVEFMCEAVNIIKTWKFVQNDVALVCYAVKYKFFAVGLMPFLEHHILSDFFEYDTPTPSPERQILCEIAYWHECLVSQVLDITKKAILKPRNQPGYVIDEFHKDFYEVLYFLYLIGMSFEVFDFIVHKSRPEDRALNRTLIVKMLRAARKPYSKQFLHVVAEALSDPDIHTLFFTSKGQSINKTQITCLEYVCRFAEQINRDDSTRTYDSDAQVFDDIRHQARRTIEISRGRSAQLTLKSFF